MSFKSICEAFQLPINNPNKHYTRLGRFDEDVERDIRIESRIGRYNFDPLHTHKIPIGNLLIKELEESEEEE